ncbi:MAG: Tol-Pal system subunit TolQ [Candidatus Dadabacteria bacterium]|nr:MAG: Tol-Pal system subunit TolQ [Candidatus Dadabacteria bacterium]
MIFGSSPVVQAVLVLLILLSVFSWAITFAKYFQLKKAGSDSEEFGAIFWETRNFSRIDDSCERLSASPLVSLFKSGYRELGHVLEESNQGNPVDLDAGLNLVERALKRAELSEAIKLERGTTFLATVASSAPFIGLFGTVWGIMNAFHGLSNNQATTIQAVAPGISEALVATAVGLAAAIPAAVAYNYFAVAVRHFRESMDKFSAEFVDLARAHLG